MLLMQAAVRLGPSMHFDRLESPTRWRRPVASVTWSDVDATRARWKEGRTLMGAGSGVDAVPISAMVFDSPEYFATQGKSKRTIDRSWTYTTIAQEERSNKLYLLLRLFLGLSKHTRNNFIKWILLQTILNYSITTGILTLTLETYESQTLFKVNRNHTVKVIIVCVIKIILLIKW